MKHYILFCVFLLLGFKAVSQDFQPYPNQVLYSWANPYESYQFSGIHFRLKKPNNFNPNRNEKYPLILFFHGAGEGGTDNEKQLIHGGQKTLNAINNNIFPGIALYPQIDRSFWATIDREAVRNIVLKLIEDYNVDPNRIYVHGLSGGASSTWNFAYEYPQLVAAMHPMSGLPNLGADPGVTTFIPTWLAQGGKDGNPAPEQGNDRVNRMRNAGANIRYSYQANTGHGTWNNEYNKPDFFSWFLEKNKTDITVLYGQSSFCEGDPINVTLGVTSGFSNYEWAKDDTNNIISSGVGANTINVTETGLYYVRFSRGSEWTPWSKPVNINRNLDAAAKVITTTGNQSLNLPALSGQQSVLINGPQNVAFYQWLKNASPINGATNASFTANEAGSYSLSVRPEQETGYEPDGVIPSEYRAAPQACFSVPSDPVVITTENGLNVPAKPTNFAANILTDNSIVVNWDDNANNELAFELYRSTQSGTGYVLVERIPSSTSSNPQRYVDQPVNAGTTYYYRMRAVNNSGGSAYTVEVSASTSIDTQAPSAPTLNVVSTTGNSINLSWSDAIDNVGVTEYEVYRNNSLVASISGTVYTNAGLPTNQIFNYTVRAKDAANNISVPSNQVTARTINSGLSYSYYHHSNLSVVNQIETNATLIRTGEVSNFDFTIRDRDNQFAFIFNGYILIPEDGNYTFFTSSDDGSRLFINENSIVNNDGTHGCQERSSTVSLIAGFAQISVEYFENGGGECLEVRWQGPGISKQLIPDEVLFQDQFTQSNIPLPPSSLITEATSINHIDLSWQDNSTNENNFEIYRSLNQNSGYEVIQVLDANAETWSDSTLTGGTTYYYKIRAINFNGSSDFAGPVSATTFAYPPAPEPPTNLMLQLVNTNNVLLNWSDNSSMETGFEVYRSTSNVPSSFTRIYTTGENVTTYEDTQTEGNSSYYYRVRAKGEGSFSSYSAIVNITTPNQSPILEPVIDRSVKYGTTLILNVAADDPDGDPLSFNFINPLPEFFSFADNGYGQGEFTISPLEADSGVYNIEFTVTDGSGGIDEGSFVITVSNNENPVIENIENVNMIAGFTEILNVFVSDNTQSNILLTASNLPDFVSFVDNGEGQGTFIISPAINNTGSFNNIKLLASDGAGGFSEESFNVFVQEVKRNYSVLVNIGSLDAPTPWNNITGRGNRNFNLISNDGLSNDVNLNIINQWPTDFYTTNLNSASYPDEVIQSFSWKNGGDANFRLQNLNPGLSYDITFVVAAGEDFTLKSLGTTRFTINSTLKSVNPNNRVVNLVKFEDVKADNNGEILVRPTGSQFILNAVVIDVYFDDGVLPSAPSNLSLTANSSTEVEISWQDNSNNEQRFEIYRSSVSETGPFQLVTNTLLNQISYTDTGLESSTLYYYKVVAVNSNGTAATPVGLVTTLNSAPVITQLDDVVMKTGNTLTLPINAIDHEGDPINYSSNNLPEFVELVDNGDGTGELVISPASSDIGFYEGVAISAEDNFGNTSTTKFLISVIDASFENTVYINFSDNSDATSPWNNINSLPNLGGVINNFTNSNGEASTIGIRVGANWTSVDNTGLPVSYNSTFPYDANVLRGSWKSDSASWNGNEDVVLTIVGLDPSSIYNIDLIVATNRWKKALADYTLQSNSKRINPLSNEENIYPFTSLVADEFGEIQLRISRTTLSEYIYLSALIIKELDANNNVPLAPTSFKAEGISRNSIELKWIDNAFNETAYEIYFTDEIGKSFTQLATVPANTQTYLHSGLSVNDHFIYKVRAVNGIEPSDYSEEYAAITLHHQLLININSNLSSHKNAPSPWNNTRRLPESGITFPALIDELGASTPEEFVLEAFRTGGSNIGGFESDNNSGVFPDNAIQAYYFAETNDPPVIFRLNNLNPDFIYDFEFLASEGLNLNPVNFATAISEFSIGEVKKILLADYNSSETVSIKNVSPDTDNSIRFDLTSSAEFNSRFGFLNAFAVNVSTPVDVAFDKINPTSPENLVAYNITENSLELVWDVSNDNVGLKEYQVFMNGELLSTVSTTSYAVQSLTPDAEYIFAVRSVDRNNNFSSFSDELVITTGLPSEGFDIFYSLPVGDLNSLNTWNSMEDGSGIAPAGFDDDFQVFQLNRDASISTIFNITGTGSKLVLNHNVTLDLNATFNGTISAGENATVNINISTAPTFTDLAYTSTIAFNSENNNIPSANYGNIILANAGSVKQFVSGNTTVKGTLNVVDEVVISGVNPNGTAIVAKGSVTLHGLGSGTASDEMITLVLAGEGEQHIESFSEDISLFALHIREGADVIFDNSDTTMEVHVGNVLGGGLVIEDNAVLNIGNSKLIVNGKGTINSGNETGVLKSSRGSIEIHSTSTITSHLYFEQGGDTVSTLTADFSNLGKVQIMNPLNIMEELSVKDGIVISSGNIKMLSTAQRTAIISQITNRGKIEGNIIAQNYVEAPSKRTYRYMGSMVKNATVADWQDNIQITGKFVGSSSGPGLKNNPSVWYFDEVTNDQWQPYPTTTNQEIMEVGKGYAVFTRVLNAPLNLELTGEAIQGDFEFALNPGTGNSEIGDGWNFISNPYQSPIQWGEEGWVSENMSPVLTVWDADYPGGGRYFYAGGGVSDSSFNGQVAIGQAFWVQAVSDNPVLRISEAAKVNSNNSKFYRNATEEPILLTVKLSKDNSEDRTFIIYSEDGDRLYNGRVHGRKRLNDIFNLSSITDDGVDLAIHNLPLNFCKDTISLGTTNMTPGTYDLSFEKMETFRDNEIFTLIDNYTGEQVNVNRETVYTFEVLSTVGPSAENRFTLIIEKPELQNNKVLATSANLLCELDDVPFVSIQNAQKGVLYTLFVNNSETSVQKMGKGDDLYIDIDKANLLFGTNVIKFKAEYGSCSTATLRDSILIEYLRIPKITFADTLSICTNESALITLPYSEESLSFKWYNTEESSEAIFESKTNIFETSELAKNTTYYYSVLSSNGCESEERGMIVVYVEKLDAPVIRQESGYLISNTQLENQWYFNGNIIDGAINDSLKLKEEGIYELSITNGVCTAYSQKFDYRINSNDKHQSFAVTLYPNPAHIKLNVKFGQVLQYNVLVRIVDLTGRQVLEDRILKGVTHYVLPVNSLSSGTYLIQMLYQDIPYQSKLVIK
ncbi:hypothetical protein C9994_06870 [Marivirga lumbricoides]|uniref:Staphylococcus aureus surface protein A n=1 Tax=Marivirga lumbricoides TaxID=1046115 RepID=A0A2T4DRS9_9BACT|nr:hypothetical protein C9994_06870 [Marivirga lumbricoides]